MELSKLIPQYYEHKQNLEEQKKIVDAENADIKREMEQQNIKDFEIDGLSAKYVVAKKETMLEDKLLAVLKEKGYTDCIKTKEYVDMDVLESMLYHNQIDTDTIMNMDKCKKVTETIQLRVTKKKGGKE